MPSNLIIIEASGKRGALADVLFKGGMRDLEVMATVGHIGTNPEGFEPLYVDSDYRETCYRLKPEKEKLAAKISESAHAAKIIYIATDDDQEGDVIARDVLRFCIEDEDKHKVKRLRLKALSVSEVKSALNNVENFDELSAARGDARRIVDRLIGSLSSDQGAVGRVQGSTLLMLQQQLPVAGIMTYTLPAADDGHPWIAQVPVYAGQEPPYWGEIEGVADVGKTEIATTANHVMNHDEILLASSLATGASLEQISNGMQKLYEGGKMTYPRSKDHAITQDAFKRLSAIARMNGAGFDQALFKALRTGNGEHAHEAPNPALLDVPINRDFALLSLENQILVTIARNLIDCGIPCRYETPQLKDLMELPSEISTLRWHRVIPMGERLWINAPVTAGFKAWTAEQSLLHFMTRNELGRPSTIVSHVQKFLSRDLVDSTFELTKKGCEWSTNIGEIFNHQNISKMIENYIDTHRKPPSEMVAEIIDLCNLQAVGSTVRENTNYEDNEISAEYFS